MDKLFSEFSSSSYEEWKAAAEKSLKGKPFNDLIKNIEGIEIQPYYSESKYSNPLVGNKTDNSWSVFQQVEGDTAKEINAKILKVLMNGVNAIEINASSDYNNAFNDVLLEHISTYIILSNEKNEIESFSEYIKFKKLDNSLINGGFVALNDFDENWEEATKIKFSYCQKHLPKMKTLFVFNQEKEVIENLAVNLAKANEYFNVLADENEATDILKSMQVHFEVGTSFFFEIAKLRAFKKVFSLLATQYGDKKGVFPFISVNTKLAVSSDEKDYKNMLRSTTQAMSAVIGGCDSLSVTTFDGESSDFSMRMARNIQLIIKDESYLDRVIDPAAGSYYVEQLTEQIAEKVWSRFKTIEQEGGYVVSIKKGAINA